MSDFTQAAAALAPLAMIVHPDTRVHDTLTVASWMSGRVYIFAVNVETGTNVDGVTFRIQGRASGSGGTTPASHFVDITALNRLTDASGTKLQIDATEPVAETEIAVNATPVTDFDRGSEIYLRDTNGASEVTATQDLPGAENQSEFGVVVERATGPNVITLADGLGIEKEVTDEIHPDAEAFAFDIPNLGGYAQIRLLVEHRGATGANIHYRAYMEAVTDVE